VRIGDRRRSRRSGKVRGRFPSSLLCGSRRLSTWVSEGTPRLVSHSEQSQNQGRRLGRSSRNDGPAALRGSAAVTSNAGRLRGCRRLLLLAYVTIVILLGWWPWNILLLALIAARHPPADELGKWESEALPRKACDRGQCKAPSRLLRDSRF
jgi:hypothetical protein